MKKLTKLIGLKKTEFDDLVKQIDSPIQLRPARLIPALKTGDEMALTSVFLSTLKLVKEFRDIIFKEIKMSRNGKIYFYTEVCFPKIDKSRIDGLILVTKKDIITEAIFIEVKSKKDIIDKIQIEKYIKIAKQLKVCSLVTISNQFVSSSEQSPLKLKTGKFNLFHLSWSHIVTQGHILLFENDNDIEDTDQVEIMKESLHYLEHPTAGVNGFISMKGWKELSENIRAKVPVMKDSEYLENAINSWYQEEADISLILSRNLGVLVKTPLRTEATLKVDKNKLVKDFILTGQISVKNAISDIKILLDFERRSIGLKNIVSPPKDKGTVAKITWIKKQVENCKKNESDIFNKIGDKIWIEADIKFARENLKVNFNNIEDLYEQSKGKDIQKFHISVIDGFGKDFASEKKFVMLTEKLVLNYYEGIVQNLSNWSQPSPKLNLSDK
tara:strand:- start:66 stop:1391 length:1326 start_codon:yes stop_codon:yes gene_type:complete